MRRNYSERSLIRLNNYAPTEDWDNLPSEGLWRKRKCDLGGWGDLRTWSILFAMFFFGIALACLAYAMPHGRDASVPQIHIY